MRYSIIFLSLVALSCSMVKTPVADLSPSDAALQNLMVGNERYVAGKSIYADAARERREMTLSKQEPRAVVIGCSDSRVPPEIIFDQGIGDIFVVRVAGNVVGPIELDSIELAAAHLHVPLIMVLGHQNCGAVNAVVLGKAKEYDIEQVAPLIEPAVAIARQEPGDLLTNSILENVKLVVEELNKNPILFNLIQSGKLKIIGGYYELDQGQVLLHN